MRIHYAAFVLSLAAAAPAAATELPVTIDPISSTVKWGPCPPIFARGCQIAVLHGDPARPNADVLLRVPGDFKLPPHKHTSAERMILVSGQLRVRYQGAQAKTLQAGHYAYGPAGLPHEATCLGGHSCTLFIAFDGPVDAHLFEGSLR